MSSIQLTRYSPRQEHWRALRSPIQGQDLVIRGYIKAISTLRQPLESVDLEAREPAAAACERSDVAAAPAAGVIGEAKRAIVMEQAMLEKFGGDSLGETKRNYEAYQKQVAEF